MIPIPGGGILAAIGNPSELTSVISRSIRPPRVTSFYSQAETRMICISAKMGEILHFQYRQEKVEKTFRLISPGSRGRMIGTNRWETPDLIPQEMKFA